VPTCWAAATTPPFPPPPHSYSHYFIRPLTLSIFLSNSGCCIVVDLSVYTKHFYLFILCFPLDETRFYVLLMPFYFQPMCEIVPYSKRVAWNKMKGFFYWKAAWRSTEGRADRPAWRPGGGTAPVQSSPFQPSRQTIRSSHSRTCVFVLLLSMGSLKFSLCKPSVIA